MHSFAAQGAMTADRTTPDDRTPRRGFGLARLVLCVVSVALRPVGKVAERVLRNAEAKQRTRRPAPSARRRNVPIEQWLMTLPCEVRDRIIAVLEDAWRGLRPRRTLPQQI